MSGARTLGLARRPAPPRRRVRVHATPAGAPPRDPRVRAPPDRRAPGRLRRRDPGFYLRRGGRLERHHLRELLGRREELDVARMYLHGGPTFSLLLPGAAAEVAVDPDPPPLDEVLGAQLGLLVPGSDPNEIRAAILRLPVHREEEVRDLLLLVELLQLHVRRQVADQGHVVHVPLLLVVDEDNIARKCSTKCVESG